MVTRLFAATPPRPPSPSAPAPAEAATEVGLDLDGDGELWHPAPRGTLLRPLLPLAVMWAILFAALYAADVLAWLLSAGVQP